LQVISIYDHVSTNPLTRFHPEMAQPQDKAPYDLSCGELIQSGAGQLLMTIGGGIGDAECLSGLAGA